MPAIAGEGRARRRRLNIAAAAEHPLEQRQVEALDLAAVCRQTAVTTRRKNLPGEAY